LCRGLIFNQLPAVTYVHLPGAMKKLLIALMAVAALAATPTFAASATMLRIAIPYEFVVNGKTLPAGTYDILESTRDIVYVRSVQGKDTAMVLADNGYAAEDADTSLAFAVVDGKHYLVNVTRPGSVKEMRRPHVDGPVVLALLKEAR
jgi:hypothetical protein